MTIAAVVRGGRIMLRITIDVDAPSGLSMAVKERLAMDLERYGDTRVVDVKVVEEGRICRNGIRT